MSFYLSNHQAALLKHFAVSDEPMLNVPRRKLVEVNDTRKDLAYRGFLDSHEVTPAGYVALALRGDFYECAECGHTTYTYGEVTDSICCKTCDSLWKRVGDTWERVES